MAFSIAIPRRSLVVLIGPPGCGKSTFARRYFPATAIISSDACRKLVSDSEDNQGASRQAFDVMATIIEKRMELGRLVVADAMHIHPSFRRRWLDLAIQHDYPAFAIVFDVTAEICIQRDHRRRRRVGPEVIRRHVERMKFDTNALIKEGFQAAWRLGHDALDKCEVFIAPGPTSRPRRSSLERPGANEDSGSGSADTGDASSLSSWQQGGITICRHAGRETDSGSQGQIG